MDMNDAIKGSVFVVGFLVLIIMINGMTDSFSKMNSIVVGLLSGLIRR